MKQDDQIDVEVCKNLQSGKFFIVIDEIMGNEALMIIPTGEKKRLKLNLFGELEEIKLHELLTEKHITQKQLLTFREYINDNATQSIEEYLNNPSRQLTKEPAYVKYYREMLNKPFTIPSIMLNYVKERKRTNWFEVKNFLTEKYGYRDSGSYSASLRVLLIDGYIKIDGRGENKTIFFQKGDKLRPH